MEVREQCWVEISDRFAALQLLWVVPWTGRETMLQRIQKLQPQRM